MSGSMYQSMHYDYNNDTIYWARTNGFGSKLMRLDRETGYAVSLGTIDAASGEQKGVGIEVTSLFSIPAEEPGNTCHTAGYRRPTAGGDGCGSGQAFDAACHPSAGERGPGGGEPYLDLQR